MKRIDAIRAIIEVLEQESITIDEAVSKKILDALEDKIGMVAPTMYLPDFKINDNGWEK